MDKREKFILWYDEVGIEDTMLVGGKNAALGEMVSSLLPQGIRVPNGFALTAKAYDYFLGKAGLKEDIRKILEGLNTHNVRDLAKRGELVRKLILKASLPEDLQEAVREAYRKLGEMYSPDPDVAVRSSATAEDLPGASFAGQQETYLNIRGVEQTLEAVKKCIASLFTNRAISYRQDKGFSHFDVALSVGVQKMVRSDLASSGIMFTLDTETGFDQVVVVSATWGLGEMIVQGKVTPDEFVVFKPSLEKNLEAIIARDLGKKDSKMIYARRGIKKIKISQAEQEKFCLENKEVLELARWGVEIEKHFSAKHNRSQPMDIEWAKDGQTGELFIVQARPETVHSSADKNVYHEYRLKEKGEILLKGTAVGTKIASGRVRVIKNAKNMERFQKGEILVTEITDPDWEPIMKIASGIVTDRGGRTSHAAIVSRELGIPCIVGTAKATKVLKDGWEVTIDCSSGGDGLIYKGKRDFEIKEHRLDSVPETKVKVMVNIGSPEEAFRNHYLPAKGVGLGRLEFIINSQIKIHPNALLDFVQYKSSGEASKKSLARRIEELTPGYADKTRFYVDELAEGIAKIGAAFWPYEVIIRFSDFKTNEYRTLLGGEFYEPVEENPMLGWRGASRYYDPKFKAAFGLECEAVKRVRENMGLGNVIPMIPFCRTVEEGEKVVAAMKEHGLDRAQDKELKIYMMCEIPSNVLLADEFLNIFDGLSIGSNDLTQLILGLDRDSGIVSHISNENNPAVKKMIAEVITIAKNRNKYIGICGQAPSDFPEFAVFLVEHGISSISLNPDTVLKTLLEIAKHDKIK